MTREDLSSLAPRASHRGTPLRCLRCKRPEDNHRVRHRFVAPLRAALWVPKHRAEPRPALR